MTKQEAIEYGVRWKNAIIDRGDTENSDAIQFLNMAIEALEQEPIIHCKDCKYWHEWENGTGSCHRSDIMWVGSDYYDYCSFAERRAER